MSPPISLAPPIADRPRDRAHRHGGDLTDALDEADDDTLHRSHEAGPDLGHGAERPTDDVCDGACDGPADVANALHGGNDGIPRHLGRTADDPAGALQKADDPTLYPTTHTLF
jgi:hypothetical protein